MLFRVFPLPLVMERCRNCHLNSSCCSHIHPKEISCTLLPLEFEFTTWTDKKTVRRAGRRKLRKLFGECALYIVSLHQKLYNMSLYEVVTPFWLCYAMHASFSLVPISYEMGFPYTFKYPENIILVFWGEIPIGKHFFQYKPDNAVNLNFKWGVSVRRVHKSFFSKNAKRLSRNFVLVFL